MQTSKKIRLFVLRFTPAYYQPKRAYKCADVQNGFRFLIYASEIFLTGLLSTHVIHIEENFIWFKSHGLFNQIQLTKQLLEGLYLSTDCQCFYLLFFYFSKRTAKAAYMTF